MSPVARVYRGKRKMNDSSIRTALYNGGSYSDGGSNTSDDSSINCGGGCMVII